VRCRIVASAPSAREILDLRRVNRNHFDPHAALRRVSEARMRASILLVLLLLGLVSPAAATDDLAMAHAVIAAQTDALARDDAATAHANVSSSMGAFYGACTLSIRRGCGSRGRFMRGRTNSAACDMP
jgi:hypothetical protein